jgi:uncharacterized membrane protein YdjX (TVP38/TMEM64 family)
MERKACVRLFKYGGIVLAVVLGIMIAARFAPYAIELARDPERLRGFLSSFGCWGFLVFILLEMLQVVIAVIPGDFFHIAAGVMYGMPLGFILAFTGEALGAFVAFALARVFGKAFVGRLAGEERMTRMGELLNSSGGIIGALVLCLIPGIPKDVLVYAAGVTPINPLRFLAVFLLCRIPDIFIKASGGAAFSSRDYAGLFAVIGAFMVFIGVGLILKKRLFPK